MGLKALYISLLKYCKKLIKVPEHCLGDAGASLNCYKVNVLANFSVFF